MMDPLQVRVSPTSAVMSFCTPQSVLSPRLDTVPLLDLRSDEAA